ncbi:MAG: hypothetical protein ACI92X_002088 [Dokdonia sp.]|jgi:hypothetical protein
MIQNEELYQKLKDLITADWDPGTKPDKKHFKLRSKVLSQIYGKQLSDNVEAKFWIDSKKNPNRLDFELRGGDDKYATAKRDIVELLRKHFVDGDKPDVLEGLYPAKNRKTKIAHIDLPTDLERRVEIIRACIKYFDQKIKEINKNYYRVINYSGDAESSEQLDKDLINIAHDDSLSETDRIILIKARKGQGIYRDSLIKLWGACAITGCDNKSILRASHIKPWKSSNNKDRLNRFNGLLLTANFDLLFDQGLITFCNQGNIIISSNLDQKTQKILGVNLDISIDLAQEHFPFLEFHRSEVFQKKS